jgi:uncharacterized protein (DUF58 family)
MLERTTRRLGLTLRASCLLAAGVTALICGVAVGATDLVRAGALVIALPILTVVVVHRSRLMLVTSRRIEPEQIDAGHSAIVHLTLHNNSRLPTGPLMLEDELPDQLRGKARFALDSVGGRSDRVVQYRIPALPRGRYKSGPLLIRLVDRFHLVDQMRSFTTTSDLLVGPVIERLPGNEAPRSHDVGENTGSHSVGTHGADDASTREYRVGDDLRKIHWRSSARTGALMVRQTERPWQGRGTLLLDLRGCAHRRAQHRDQHAGSAGSPAAGHAPGSTEDAHLEPRETDSMEWAISAAASIVTHMQLAHRQIELVFGSGPTPAGEHPLGSPAVRLDEPRQARQLLADVTACADLDLTACAVPLARSSRDATLIAVLGEPDPLTLHMLLEMTERRRGTTGIALVLDTVTWADPSKRIGLAARGVAVADFDEAADRPAQVAARRLRSAGWHAVVVERGESVSSAWARVTAGLNSAISTHVLVP